VEALRVDEALRGKKNAWTIRVQDPG
jgi:hypothetical protein